MRELARRARELARDIKLEWARREPGPTRGLLWRLEWLLGGVAEQIAVTIPCRILL